MGHGTLSVSPLRRAPAGPAILRAAALVIAVYAGVLPASAQDSAAKPCGLAPAGRALAERLCAQCHAVGVSGTSPHAAAPPFRRLSRRLDLDSFEHQLRNFSSGHPDMPTFRFSRQDARALIAYLRSIQQP
jgi:mono/diheme cytochrome c family protein